MIGKSIPFPRFANVPILAKFAAEIASGGSKGKNACPRIEMIQWFFFDRVDAKSATATIGGQNHLAMDILAYKTKSPLAFG